MHNMCELYFNGEHAEALKIQLGYLPLNNSVFIETNPIPVKTAMNLMGMNVGHLRLPLCEMEENNLQFLKKELKAYNIPLKEDI